MSLRPLPPGTRAVANAAVMRPARAAGELVLQPQADTVQLLHVQRRLTWRDSDPDSAHHVEVIVVGTGAQTRLKAPQYNLGSTRAPWRH